VYTRAVKPIVRGIALACVTAWIGVGGGEVDADAARTIGGRVYVDVDRDGGWSEGDHPVAGVRVWLDTTVVTVTDDEGGYRLEGDGTTVWAQTPDGYVPGPVWRAATVGDAVDLALVPIRPVGPLRFVVISDAHIGKEGYDGESMLDGAALRAALDQALDLDPAPWFFVMTGDLTNRETSREMSEAARVLRSTSVPFVPVAGNHDWVEKGDHYRRAFGPPSYSFDLGGVHFVTLNDNPKRDPDVEFLLRDLAGVPAGRLVVAFLHRPPKDPALAAIESGGVDYLFSGHWHANRYVRTGRLTQINTEPILRAGLDFTPAGYRVVTIRDGVVEITHHTLVDRPVTSIVWPGETCVAAGPLRAIAAVELGPSPVRVTASLDGGAPVSLAAAGGWAHAGEVGAIAAGRHRIVLTVSTGEREHQAVRDFETCAEAAAPVAGAWTQHQAGPDHRGASPHTIHPPLRGLWAVPIGAHLQGGSVAVADGRVFVPVVDLADGTRGGVVALDARTGAEQWRYLTGHSVRNTPAVADGVVVIPSNDGALHALDAATGALRWRHDLGDQVSENRSALTAAPVISGGVVYAGVVGRFAAIDLMTGRERWRAEPAPKMIDQQSYGAAAIAGDTVIAPFGLGKDGVVAWDVMTGRERWRLDGEVSYGVQAAPVVDGDQVMIVNSRTIVHAVGAADGRIAWTRRIDARATGMSAASAATPVLAGRLLIVPTQYDGLAAVDVDRGEVRWRARVGRAALRVAHNQDATSSVPGSPALAGEVLWAGAADGVLRALEPDTGRTLWSTDLGAPILSGIAAAGDVLFVGTFDGTIRAFATDPTVPAIREAPALAGRGPGVWIVVAAIALGLAAIALTWSRSRR
jgi:outer membrane protein assembly factor BamB/predicted phosphodiesterase